MFFLKGLLIAMIFGLPAGAIGVLCINRSIEKGFISGFITGLGSSVADTIYAVIGAFGLTLISDLLQRYQKIIGIAGGVLILLYGSLMFIKRKDFSKAPESSNKLGITGFFLSSFAIAILNPATILTFLIAFSSFGIVCKSLFESLSLVAGIFLGTVLWWFAMSFASSRFRDRFTEKAFVILRIVCSLLMIGFGVLCFIRSIRSFQ